MDHFALPNDTLFDCFEKGMLHRNFMGYTTNTTKLLVGLGCSSISDTWDGFSQNIKTVEEYQKVVNEGHFPVFKRTFFNRRRFNYSSTYFRFNV